MHHRLQRQHLPGDFLVEAAEAHALLDHGHDHGARHDDHDDNRAVEGTESARRPCHGNHASQNCVRLDPTGKRGLLSAYNCILGSEQIVRILLVEDEPRAAQMLAKGLREEAYAVDVVGDGEAAVYTAAVMGYEAIILEVMLPLRPAS
jgi:hypothetical protein